MTDAITDVLKQFVSDNPEWKDHPDLLLMPPDSDELQVMFGDTASPAVIQVANEYVAYRGTYVTRGAIYAMMRLNGNQDRFAVMCALQRGPVLNTDDTFFAGMGMAADSMPDAQFAGYLQAAKRQGFTPPQGAVYFPGLARRPGDREAWVTRSQGRSYIRKLCESRGWACEGGVNVKAREPDSDPLAPENCKPLGDDIIRKRAAEMIKKDPSVATMDRRELRQKIIDKHGPSK